MGTFLWEENDLNQTSTLSSVVGIFDHLITAKLTQQLWLRDWKIVQLYSIVGRQHISKAAIIMVAFQKFSVDLNKFVPHHPTVEADLLKDLHEIAIVKFFSTVFCNLRINTQNKKLTQNLAGKGASCRQKLTKIILFHNI